jgi:hypothetical protein
MSGYDVAIAYRIYSKVAKSAIGLPFSDDKLRLSEVCLKSLRASLGTLRAKIWVLLDNCPEEYADLFSRYFNAQDLVLMRLPATGNQGTFGMQLDILLQQTDSDFVYFAEDDYFYLPGQFFRMLEFMRAYDDVDFITPYDHLDCYTRQIHRMPQWLRVHANQHWRTAASTCLTFLTSKRTLRKNRFIFRTYTWRNYDCSLWLSLTKRSLFDPREFLRFVFQDLLFAKIIAKAWLYGWPQIIFGRSLRLWVPVPALATHVDTRALSPTIDWATLMNNFGGSPTSAASTSASSQDLSLSHSRTTF